MGLTIDILLLAGTFAGQTLVTDDQASRATDDSHVQADSHPFRSLPIFRYCDNLPGKNLPGKIRQAGLSGP